MSDAPRYEPASYDRADEDVPPMDELDRVAFDAVVRSAPRFGRFIGTGVFIGFIAGLIIGLVLPNTTAVGRGTVALLVASGFAIIGAIVAGALVVSLDGTKRAPTAHAGFPWEPPLASDDAEPQQVASEETTEPSVGQTANPKDAK